jgi:hypothetical protein
VCAFGFAMLLAFVSDRTRHRFIFGIFPLLVGIAGFGILLAHPESIHLQYASLFLATAIYAGTPILWGWVVMNVAGHLRRGVCAAFLLGFGNIGAFIAVYTFPTKDAPRYVKGYVTCISSLAVAVVSAGAYGAACIAQNKAREKTMASGAVEEGLNDREKELRGDLDVEYRYSY